MKLALRVLLACAAAGFAASAAMADKASDKAAETQRIREVAARYATCVIGQSAKRARRYLVEEGQPPITGACLVSATQGSGGIMRFPGQNYRYALADALLVRDYPAGVPAQLTDAPKLVHDEPSLDEATLPADAKKAAVIREHYSHARSYWMMDVIGDCSARANPAAAFALISSKVGSAPERAAFTTLKPAIAGCLPVDATIRFDPATLRGAIALNLYRLAYLVKMPPNA